MYTRYPCKLSITSNLHFWTKCNLSPCIFYLLTGGVFYILILSAGCEILGMRSTHTPTSIFSSSKFTHPHPQNCTKSTHNLRNNFDTDFDTHLKYPLTTIYNELSDKLKITQNLPNPSKKHPLSFPLTLLSNIQTISQPSH